MSTLKLTVTGMSCMGCVNSVKALVSALPGITRVQVNLETGLVEVDHDPAQSDRQSICTVIREGGYGVAD